MEMTYVRSDRIVLRMNTRKIALQNTHVRGNVSGHITTLGLNDRKSSEGSSTELVVHLGGTLKETRVQVEDITGVSLTTGGTTKQEGHLTVSDGLLGQVIVDDESYKNASKRKFCVFKRND